MVFVVVVDVARCRNDFMRKGRKKKHMVLMHPEDQHFNRQC